MIFTIASEGTIGEDLVVSLQLFKFTSRLAHLAKTNCAKPETLADIVYFMINFIPEKPFELVSAFSIEEVRAKISNAIIVSNIDSMIRTDDPVFAGNIENNNFEMTPLLSYRNNFKPVLNGEITNYKDGSKLLIRMRPSSIIFIIFWNIFTLFMILLFLIYAIPELDFSYIYFLLFPVGGHLIIFLGFRFQVDLTIEVLQKLVKGKIYNVC